MTLTVYQVDAFASSRGGFVDMECLPNNRVKLIGRAVTVLKGSLFV